MLRLLVRPNLPMILPSARRVTLGGEAWIVKELQLRHIAKLERRYTCLAGHPHQATASRPRPPIEDKEARQRWNRDRVMASQNWPPSLNSDAFLKAKASPQGLVGFLGVMLRRFQKTVTLLQIEETALAMSRDEWGLLERIAWGYADWEIHDPASGATDSGPSPGTDWPEIVLDLVTKHHMTFEQVGRLYVSQLRLLSTPNGQRFACLPSLEPQGTA